MMLMTITATRTTNVIMMNTSEIWSNETTMWKTTKIEQDVVAASI